VGATFPAVCHGLWILSWRSLFNLRKGLFWLALVIAQPLLAWLALPDQYPEAFLDWTLKLYVALMIPIYCLIAAGGMIRDEAQSGTLPYLVTRPVSRARLYLGKFLCQWVWIQVGLTLNSLLLTLVGLTKQIPELPAFLLFLLLTQALIATAFAALSALLGLISPKYVLLGIVYGFVVEIGIGQIPTNINVISISRHSHTLLANLPSIQSQFHWSPSGTFWSVAALLALTAVFLIAGAVLFSMREYSQASEEKN